MPSPTHLDYPELVEGLTSDAAWDEIAKQLGVDYVDDIALFDFPTDLVRVSDTVCTVQCYIMEPVPYRAAVTLKKEFGRWRVC